MNAELVESCASIGRTEMKKLKALDMDIAATSWRQVHGYQPFQSQQSQWFNIII